MKPRGETLDEGDADLFSEEDTKITKPRAETLDGRSIFGGVVMG